MRRVFFCAAGLMGLLLAGWSWAAPLSRNDDPEEAGTPSGEGFPRKQVVAPFSAFNLQTTFAGREPALAIIYGDGRTFMGLYVYDHFGNCVDKDDVNHPSARDDVSVHWLPTRPDAYVVEAVNLGPLPNNCDLVCK